MNLLHLGSKYPRQESHLRRELRKLAFFLLNYGDEKWCAMPVLPRRPRFGRPPCCCYTNDAKWWLLPESRRPLLLFREALISLS